MTPLYTSDSLRFFCRKAASFNVHYREPMLLARNTGKGFVDVSAEAGSIFQKAWVGRGLAIGDIDNDGRMDAVVTGNDGTFYVLHNSTQTQNHWLTLELVGHRSNRDAIGAEVKLITSKGSQMATVTTAGSYLSSSDKRVHFGLGPESASNPAKNKRSFVLPCAR
jgi:hypothetical protein